MRLDAPQRPIVRPPPASVSGAEVERAGRSTRRPFGLPSPVERAQPQAGELRSPTGDRAPESRGGTLLQRLVVATTGAERAGPTPAADRLQAREGVSLATRFTRGGGGQGAAAGVTVDWQEARRAGKRLSKAAEWGADAMAAELKRVEADIRARARPASNDPMEQLKASMGLHQTMAATYLSLQEQMQRSVTSLLSNLLKRRHDCVMSSMRQWH